MGGRPYVCGGVLSLVAVVVPVSVVATRVFVLPWVMAALVRAFGVCGVLAVTPGTSGVANRGGEKRAVGFRWSGFVDTGAVREVDAVQVTRDTNIHQIAQFLTIFGLALVTAI